MVGSGGTSGAGVSIVLVVPDVVFLLTTCCLSRLSGSESSSLSLELM